MKNNKKNILAPALAGLAIGGLYHFIRGNGIFNKPRFPAQHEAVRRYLDGHYPNASYSVIKETGQGWSCIVTTRDGQFMLHLARTTDGVFVFSENPL